MEWNISRKRNDQAFLFVKLQWKKYSIWSETVYTEWPGHMWNTFAVDLLRHNLILEIRKYFYIFTSFFLWPDHRLPKYPAGRLLIPSVMIFNIAIQYKNKTCYFKCGRANVKYRVPQSNDKIKDNLIFEKKIINFTAMHQILCINGRIWCFKRKMSNTLTHSVFVVVRLRSNCIWRDNNTPK